MDTRLQTEEPGDVMKLKLGAATALVLIAGASSLTCQEVNAEIVRLNKIAGERLDAHDWDSAERDYLHALDLAEKSEGSQTRATLRQNLGVLYAEENRFKDAEKQFRLSYELLKAKFGEDHPTVALALNRIGEVTCFEGQFAVGRSLFERSLSILNAQSPKNPEIARVLTNLAGTEWSLGNLSRAGKILDQVTTLFESAGRSWQPLVAFALQLRTRIAEEEGDLRSAEASSQQALSILEQSSSPQDLLAGLVTRGQVLLHQGDPQRAQAHLERALQLARRDSLEESPVGGALMSTLAQCYHMQGRSGEAENSFERAIGTYQRVLGPDHPNLLSTMQDYAHFLREMKRKKDAKRLELYVHDHLSASTRLNSTRDIVDFRQLLQEQKH
jgi:tetratricopeptide (TPR) repeat protein